MARFEVDQFAKPYVPGASPGKFWEALAHVPAWIGFLLLVALVYLVLFGLPVAIIAALLR